MGEKDPREGRGYPSGERISGDFPRPPGPRGGEPGVGGPRKPPEDFRCFEEIRSFVHRHTGIFLGDQKRMQVFRHVRERMGVLGIDREERFINHLRFFDPQRKEFQVLINRVTVNETYFFRDFPQLQSFAEDCLPELVAGCRRGGRRGLRVLSAGCATGEEPYTLAIILREMLEEEGLPFEVVAVDINDSVLERARRGRYGRRAVKDVPKAYLDRHFHRVGEHFVLRDETKRPVSFFLGNLADPQDMGQLGPDFDVVFCRNVLIYFDDEARQRMVEQFFHHLRPGGYIFLGHAEPVSRMSSRFRVKRSRGMVLYQKPSFGRGAT